MLVQYYRTRKQGFNGSLGNFWSNRYRNILQRMVTLCHNMMAAVLAGDNNPANNDLFYVPFQPFNETQLNNLPAGLNINLISNQTRVPAIRIHDLSGKPVNARIMHMPSQVHFDFNIQNFYPHYDSMKPFVDLINAIFNLLLQSVEVRQLYFGGKSTATGDKFDGRLVTKYKSLEFAGGDLTQFFNESIYIHGYESSYRYDMTSPSYIRATELLSKLFEDPASMLGDLYYDLRTFSGNQIIIQMGSQDSLVMELDTNLTLQTNLVNKLDIHNNEYTPMSNSDAQKTYVLAPVLTKESGNLQVLSEAVKMPKLNLITGNAQLSYYYSSLNITGPGATNINSYASSASYINVLESARFNANKTIAPTSLYDK